MRSKWSKPSSSGLVNTDGRDIGQLLLRASYRVRTGLALAPPCPGRPSPGRTVRGSSTCRQRQRGNQGGHGARSGRLLWCAGEAAREEPMPFDPNRPDAVVAVIGTGAMGRGIAQVTATG